MNKHWFAYGILFGFTLFQIIYQFTLGWWIGLTHLVVVVLLAWAFYIIFFTKDKGDTDEK